MLLIHFRILFIEVAFLLISFKFIQGWAAVVANLEDIYSEFCERSKSFKESFRKHRLKKEEYHDMLNT